MFPLREIPAASTAPDVAVTLRYASPDDAAALARLAALDERPVPKGPVLLAEVEGELRAAVGLRDGTMIADPRRPAAGLLELLVTRAAQLRGHDVPVPVLRTRFGAARRLASRR